MTQPISMRLSLCSLVLLGISGVAVASKKYPEMVGAERHTLNIALHVPPALVYVLDSQGKRAGMDPAGSVSPTGGGKKINERQNTDVESQNIASDDPEDDGEGQATTMWSIGLFDTEPGEYVVVLRGLIRGYTEVHVDHWFIESSVPPGPAIKTMVLVEPGSERRLRVQFDPTRIDADGYPLTKVLRVVARSDLSRDLETACQLGQVSPEGVCQSLKVKAAAAAKALEKGRTNAARGAVKAFLAELKAQGGKHVQEPALTILREEAEALLNPPPPVFKSKPKPIAKSKTEK